MFKSFFRKFKKSKVYNHAKKELEILTKTVDEPIVAEFIPEILALVNKFGKSGQSGGSAPFTAKAIANTVEKLCMFKPICPITGTDDEWFASCYDKTLQNKRCSAIFKDEDGTASYIDAVIYRDEKGCCFHTSRVLYSKGKINLKIKSFPFTPKTFYIDVVGEDYNADNEPQVYRVKDENQLIELFEYYKNI